MEVLASLAAGLKGDAAKGAAARNEAKRYLRLTKAQSRRPRHASTVEVHLLHGYRMRSDWPSAWS